MTKKRFILVIIIGILLFLALVGYRINEKKKQAKLLEDTKPPSTTVSVITPQKGKISEIFTTTGTVVSETEVNIISKATGKITSLYVEEGVKVQAGQTLAQIEHTELDAQLLQAKAQINVAKSNLDLLVNGPLTTQLTQAEAGVKQAEANLSQVKVNLEHTESDLNRYKDLAKQGAITSQQIETYKTQFESQKKQYDSAKQQLISSKASLKALKDGTRSEQVNSGRGQLEQARASIQLLEAQLANYTVRSPIAGVVTKKYLEVGSMASTASPIFTVSQTSKPELEMNVPEKQILKIKTNQLVDIQSSAFIGKTIQLKIKEISPIVDTQTRLVKVKGLIKSDLPLKIGMIFDCKIILKEETNSIVLPAEAIVAQDNKNIVYLAVNNKAVEKIVKVGLQNPEEVQVLDGITEADKVITKGNTFIRSGDAIKIEKDITEGAK